MGFLDPEIPYPGLLDMKVKNVTKPSAWQGLLGAMGGNEGLLNFGLSMLANSGPSPQRQSFGQIFGNSYLQSQHLAQQRAAEKMRQEYMQAQMERMRQPEPAGPLVPIVGPDGKITYQTRDKAIGAEVPQDPSPASPNGPSEVEIARVLNDPSTPDGVKRDLRGLLDRKYRESGGEPLVPVRVGDKTILLPRSQAVGMEPGTQRDSFVPTEGERTAANYHDRMSAAEKKLGAYVPTVTDYAAASALMSGGPMIGSAANSVLSPKGQLYFQAAADWVRAKLRKESGAVISPEEMAQEIKTYFPVPGDTKGTIEQKRQARQQAELGMRQMSGRAIGPPGFAPVPGASPPPSPMSDDPLGLKDAR